MNDTKQKGFTMTTQKLLTLKRYNNRKLYNTETSKYANLTNVLKHIKEGGNVKVVDFSGNDITNATLKASLTMVDISTEQMKALILNNNLV